jgi:hypothetical protein
MLPSFRPGVAQGAAGQALPPRPSPAWLRVFLPWLLLLASFAGTAVAQAPAPVGEIVMAMGDVRRAGAPGALRAGDAVREGDEFVSGAGGHLYIRSSDGGFVSLRPNSRLRFEVWRHDPANPAESRFRVVLEQGVMRSISGPGVKAARERYRLNTPVAAIGLRGTDFSVYADAQVTRVSVREGGVVMAPLGGACQAAGFGPCEGGSARDLFADRASLMQLRRGDAMPAVLEAGRQPGPDLVAPPLPDENGAAGGQPKPAGKTSSKGGSGHAAGADLQPAAAAVPLAPTGVDQEPLLAERVEGSIGAQLPAPGGGGPGSGGAGPGPGSGPGPGTDGPAPRAIEWGRWRDLASAGPGVSLESLTAGGRRIEALNSLFALVRDPAAAGALPKAGVFGFQLAAHEGYLYNPATKSAQAAKVGESSLTIDFDQGRFATRLGLSAGTRSTVLDAQGKVYATGEMVHDLTRSNGAVSGVVGGPGGTQAGYLYTRTIEGNRQFVGATFWQR